MYFIDLFLKNALLCFLFLLGTSATAQQQSFRKKPLNLNKPLSTIAFGSCNNQTKPQEIWKPILQNNPDLWIWLGDNIYADTEDMHLMAKKYQKQKTNPSYQFFLSKCAVIGTWDDHDYGKNDACSTYPERANSQHLMLDFLDVPSSSPARRRDGIYQTYTFGPLGKQVRVLILDARYFRSPLKRMEGEAKRCHPNMEGTVLGEAQWKWLEKVLAESKSDAHLIVSGIQVLSDKHAFEKWADFPKERQRLLDLLSKTCPSNPILLSGDRHMAEVSEIQIAGFKKPIREITSSGLTHTRSSNSDEVNPYRVGKTVVKKHFAVLTINWEANPTEFQVEIRGTENQVHQNLEWTY